jgi:hypothetical protein
MKPTPRLVLSILLPLALFLVFFASMALVEFATPNLPDNDGFYHIKLAYLLRTEGLKPDFIWLPQSILSESEFYDHHFLFHVALIPFTFGDLRLGAKWAAVAFASLAYLAVWLLFKRQRLPLAWLWALGLLGISEAFLYRMSVTRAQSLSLALLALGMLWLLENKPWRLALLGFFYVWMYDAFPLLLALGVLHAIAVAQTERRLILRPLLFIGLGIALGLLVNPYFPANITFFIRHIMPKLTNATSVRVGNEWFPYDTGQLLENSLPALIAFTSATLALGLSGKKMETRTTLAFLATLMFGLMLFQARRFVEYFPPFALIFAAFAWSPFFERSQPEPLDEPALSRPGFQQIFLAELPLMILTLLVIAGTVKSLPAAMELIRNSKSYNLYSGASAWLEHNTPTKALVFQTDWDDFPRLFYYNTHNTYLIGLDPTYMQLYDAKLYDEWVKITQGKVEQPSQVILSRFGAHYIHTDLSHTEFIRQAAHDPGLKEVYRDNQAVIFEVIGP